MKKAIMTTISQYEVKILSAKDRDDYESNRPGKKWELVEYIGSKDKDGKPVRAWAPNYQLIYAKFSDHSKLKIKENI